jgi:hypothetical protein
MPIWVAVTRRSYFTVLPRKRNFKFVDEQKPSEVASKNTCQPATYGSNDNEVNMLTRLIVASYAWLLEVALWVSLSLAGIAGYNTTVPLLQALGASLFPEVTWKILGAGAFIVVAFLLLAVITGPLLILMDVRHAVKSIEAEMVSREGVEGAQSKVRREPTI